MPAPLEVPWSVIAAQAAGGASLEDLAQHWNIPIGTLKARSAREGWKQFAREQIAQKTGTEVVKAGNSTMQQNATSKSMTLLSTLGTKSKVRAARVGDNTLRAISRRKEDKLIASAPAYLATVNALAKVHGWGSDGKNSAGINLAIQVNASNVPQE